MYADFARSAVNQDLERFPGAGEIEAQNENKQNPDPPAANVSS
jgi:hypothetical protein